MQLQTADPHDAIAAQLRDLAPRRAPDASEPGETPVASPEPANEPALRAVPLNDNAGDIRIPSSRGRSGLVAILLAVCAGVAATMAWHSYGGEAKQRLSSFVPQLLAYVPMVMQGTNAQPNDAASQAAVSQTAAAQPAVAPASAQEASNEPATPAPSASAPAAATPAAEAPPAQAAVPPELMQSIEAMTREIDSLKQTVQQLQAGQQQLSHDIAKVNEHGTRHKVAAQTSKPAPRPAPRRTSAPADTRTVARYSPPPAPTQRQLYPQSYPQGAVQHDAYIPPPAPPRLPPQPGDSSAPRPPMPLQ